MPTRSYPVSGMHCVNCANGIEKAVSALSGVESAAVHFATETLEVTFKNTPDHSEIVKTVEQAGFSVPMAKTRIPVTGMHGTLRKGGGNGP